MASMYLINNIGSLAIYPPQLTDFKYLSLTFTNQHNIARKRSALIISMAKRDWCNNVLV